MTRTVTACDIIVAQQIEVNIKEEGAWGLCVFVSSFSFFLLFPLEMQCMTWLGSGKFSIP